MLVGFCVASCRKRCYNVPINIRLGKKALTLKNHSVVKHVGTGLFLGGVAGLVTGTVITLYKFCAHHVIHLSEQHYEFLRHHPLWLIPIAALLLGLAVLLGYIYRRKPNLRGGGIPTAIAVLRGWLPFRWVRNAIGIFTLSLTTFLVGVPLGNEGPSVQLGTALGKGCSKMMGKRGRGWDRYGMTAGACAGFSTATGAPLSGVLFAVEEAHNRVAPLLLVVATAAVAVARLVSDFLAPLLGVSSTLFPSMTLRPLTAAECWIPLAIGVLFGLFATLFLSFYRHLANLSNNRLAKVPGWCKIYTVLLLTVGMGLCSYSYISTGHELILSLFDGETVLMLAALLLVRTVLTVGANITNITGGIFLPVLAIGTLLSALFAEGVTAAGLDASYYPVILVLGITACIAGMMKMPLTAIAFAIEALSAYELILPILLVVGVAYGMAELFDAVSVNDRVLDSRLEQINKGHTPVTAETTVTVQAGSFAVDKEIRDIFWPDGLFVLSVDKKRALGGKTLREGDRLHVRYRTIRADRLWKELEDIIGEQEKE